VSDAADVIERVLMARILTPNLTVIPPRGASQADFDEEERSLPRPLSLSMKRLLSMWNGLDLDVVRLYGCGAVVAGIKRLSSHQVPLEPGMLRELSKPIIIGSDPSGFVYIEDDRGQVWCLDTDGGDRNRVADSLDDFFGRVVFGADAETFAGSEWAKVLRDAGLVT